MSISPEDILNLSENYDLNDIKRSYYSLSRLYHPDSSHCNFLTKEEKKNIFIVFENAYKELIQGFQSKEVDVPMYSQVEYENDCYVERNDSLTSIDKFNSEFEKVYKEENKDNPWSIHYDIVVDSSKFDLDVLRPDNYKKDYHYEYGVNYCSDFTRPGDFTDINNLPEPLNNDELHCTDLESLLKSRENIEYSDEVYQQEEYKRKVIKQIEDNKRVVQMERDFRLLKLKRISVD